MTQGNTTPKKIIILGGGTAGWMAASLLNKAWAHTHTEILLIESDHIEKIGVGEGSTPSLKLFFEHLGITEQEWMPFCNATYKCGISFPNWSIHQGFEQYIHPFYSHADWKAGNAFIHNANLRRQGVSVDAHPDKYWLQSTLIKQNKSPIAHTPLAEKMDYGYHFDSALMGAFLKKRAIKLGVKNIVDTVEEVKLNAQGEVAQLILNKHQPQSAELYIDCSGFASLLSQKTLKVPFHSYSDCLFNDRAIAIPSAIDNSLAISPQTTSTALSNGWAWKIPLSSRYGNGYVYSSKYISDADAEAELRQHIGKGCINENARLLKFNLGRISQHWHKNVLAVGLSQGFIEPLEATALMLIQYTVESFIQRYPSMKKQCSSPQENQAQILINNQQAYNDNLNNVFDNIKDYIVSHYRLNSREDSQYWRENRDNSHHSQRVSALLKAWDFGDFEASLKQHQAELSYFTPSWYCLFAGKGRFPTTLTAITPQDTVAPVQDIEQYCQKVSELFIDHQQQLQKTYGSLWESNK